MSRVPLVVQVQGSIQLDDATAEVLEHITGYDFQQWFVEQCSGRVPLEKLKAATQQLNGQMRRIVEARDVAIKAINDQFKPKPSE